MFGFFKKKTPQAQAPQTDKPAAQTSSPPPPTSGHFTDPINELEHAIIAKSRGEIDVYKFIEILFNSNIAVVVPDGQFTMTDGTAALVENPRMFSIMEPGINFLAFFSSAQRAARVKEKYPEYRYAVALHAGDLLMSLGSGYGLIINPGWDINFRWSPDQVAAIKKMIAPDN
jgi:hypothetical protein